MAWHIEETKSKLKAAAVQEFAERGLAGTRVESIARRAGVNKGADLQLLRQQRGPVRARGRKEYRLHVEKSVSNGAWRRWQGCLPSG